MASADFAATQQRVALCRQRRQNAHQERLAQRQQHRYTSNAFSQLQTSAQTFWTTVNSHWETICGREGTRPAFRVGQVDAELLDEELLELLKGQVGEGLKYYGPHLRDDYGPEILLSLRAILFKLTIWDHNASYGASLQNLQYTDARDKSLAPKLPSGWQKALYGLVSVGGRYAWTKWEDHLLDLEAGYDEPSPRIRLLERLSSMVSTTHSMAAFASFTFFLVNGKYRTILDRIFSLQLTPRTSQVSREISFEYLNRQLVWHAFTEFLLFLLPLVGISRWHRWLSRAWRKAQSVFRRTGTEDDEDAEAGGELGFLPERTCAICYQDQNTTASTENDTVAFSGTTSGVVGSSQTDITNPYETIPCGCIYCFVCLAQRLEAEDGQGWTCLRCGELVKECKPWDGDVLLEARPSSSFGKSVSFVEDEEVEKRKEVDEEQCTTLNPMPLEDGVEGFPTGLAEDEDGINPFAARSLLGSLEWAGLGQSGIDTENDEEELDTASGELEEELDTASGELEDCGDDFAEDEDDEEDAAEADEDEEEIEDDSSSFEAEAEGDNVGHLQAHEDVTAFSDHSEAEKT